jgi:Domain of unknown function (DUF397)
MDRQLITAQWRKSSYSGTNGGQCVEVAASLPGVVAVRDSKNVTGPELEITDRAWSAFITDIKRGEFDL